MLSVREGGGTGELVPSILVFIQPRMVGRRAVVVCDTWVGDERRRTLSARPRGARIGVRGMPPKKNTLDRSDSFLGSLTSSIVEAKSAQKDLSYWEAQVETPRGPIVQFESATLKTLAAEYRVSKAARDAKISASSSAPSILHTSSSRESKKTFTEKVVAPLQIWGDGDGSYFDRWLAVTPPKNTYNARGFIEPTQGFKAARKHREKAMEENTHGGDSQYLSNTQKKLLAQISKGRGKAAEDHFVPLESEFKGMFYNSSCSSAGESGPDVDEDGSVYGSSLSGSDSELSLLSNSRGRSGKHGRSTTTLQPEEHLAEQQLSPRSRKYVGSPAKYRLFQRYHKENKNLHKLPPLDLPPSTTTKKGDNHGNAGESDPVDGNVADTDDGEDGEVPFTQRIGTLAQSSLSADMMSSVATDSARRNYLSECCKKHLPPMSLQVRKDKTSELDLSYYGIGDGLCQALAAGLRGLPNLESLDLSDNRLTGLSLAKTLTAAGFIPTLTALNLGSNKLGVEGMRGLMELLSRTQTLESLGIADSRCGDKEAQLLALGLSQNSTLKEVDLHGNNFGVGAGLAFAKTLDQRYSKCTIEDLDLSWTQIRKEGAVAIAQAIAHNTTLEKLDLSYCAFGDNGTMHMMESLRTNRTMNWLEMDNNQIKGRGALVIANSLEENKTLTYLQLWDNPLGKSGGRAMLRCVARTGDVRSIDLENCNFEIEEDGLFDPAEPPSRLDLDLTNLYERAVANEFVRIIGTKPGCQIKKMTLDGQSVQFTQLEPDQLEGYKSEDEFDSDKEDGESEDYTDSEDEFDSPEPDEPKPQPTREELRKQLLFRVNDDFYEVPDEGRLQIDCAVQPRKAKKDQKVSKDGLKGIMSLLFESERLTRRDRVMRLQRASEDMYMSSKQLIRILKKIGDQEERREIMDALMPRLTDPENKLKLLISVLGESHIAKLEEEMGCLFHFTPQNPTGHYELNLDVENDRKLFKQLVEINNDDKRWAMERSGRGDVSRDGDWEHFRNGIYKGRPIKMHADGMEFLTRHGDCKFCAKIVMVHNGNSTCTCWACATNKWPIALQCPSCKQQPGNFGMTWTDLIRDGLLEFDYVHAKTPSRKARGLVQTSTKWKRFMKNLGLSPGCDFKEKPVLNPQGILAFFRPKYDLSQLEGKKLQRCAASRLQFWYRKHLKAKREWEAAQPRELTQEEKEEVAAMRLQGWYSRLRVKWYEQEQQEMIDKVEDRLLVRELDIQAGKEVERLEEPYCLVLDVINAQFPSDTEIYRKCDALMARALFTDGTKIDMDMEEAADALEMILEGEHCANKAVSILRQLQEEEKEELARQAALEEANRPKATSGMGGAFGSMLLMAKARQSAEEKMRVRTIMTNGVYPLRRAVSKIYVTCEQVAQLLRCFPGGETVGGEYEPFCKWYSRLADTDVGSKEVLPAFCRVTVLQSCFNRIVDLENIWSTILLNRDVLSHADYQVALVRLGYLNLFNPMGNSVEPGPDLIYDLDMSIKEHYTLTLMLIELADVEPGENFLDETWTKFDKQAKTEYIPGERGDYVLVPGWELPMSWVENGPPDMGWLHVYYYSGRDVETGKLVGKWGCKPVWDLRKKMMANVLLGNKSER